MEGEILSACRLIKMCAKSWPVKVSGNLNSYWLMTKLCDLWWYGGLPTSSRPEAGLPVSSPVRFVLPERTPLICTGASAWDLSLNQHHSPVEQMDGGVDGGMLQGVHQGAGPAMDHTQLTPTSLVSHWWRLWSSMQSHYWDLVTASFQVFWSSAGVYEI